MAEQDVLSKPPAIRVGVQGFSAFTTERTQAAKAIDWERLVGLPPFAMFIAERHAGKFPGLSMGLYAEYCDWHAAKGYWPNETPMGELKSNDQ